MRPTSGALGNLRSKAIDHSALGAAFGGNELIEEFTTERTETRRLGEEELSLFNLKDLKELNVLESTLFIEIFEIFEISETTNFGVDTTPRTDVRVAKKIHGPQNFYRSLSLEPRMDANSFVDVFGVVSPSHAELQDELIIRKDFETF